MKLCIIILKQLILIYICVFTWQLNVVSLHDDIALSRDPKTNMDRQKYEKRSSKTIDIVSYALKVNGVKHVFVAHFRSSDTFESL